MTDDWAKTSPFLDAVRDFESAHPNVRVAVDTSSIGQMMSKVVAAGNAGFSVDVAQGHAGTAARDGWARPVDDLWEAAHLEQSGFQRGAMQEVTWAGADHIRHLYGVPLDINAVALLYNADHFASKGLPPPTTWKTFEDLERAAQALASEPDPQQAIGLSLSGWTTGGWITANGGRLFSSSPDGTFRPALDSPPVVEALGFLGDLAKKQYAYVALVDSRDALALFRSGRLSLLPTGSWDLVKLRQEAGDGKYKAAPIPGGVTGRTRGAALGGSSLFISKGSRHPKLAFQFMVHLISDRYALRFAKEEGRLPVRTRTYRDPFFENPDVRVFVEQIEAGEILEGGKPPLSTYGAAIRKVLVDHEDAAVALHEAQAILDRQR